MIPTPGQKVWIDNPGGDFPAGIYAAVVIEPANCWWEKGQWKCDIEGLPRDLWVHQDIMRPRDDPPPQQEPKREDVGNGWDNVQHIWSPARVKSRREVV